MNYPYVRQLPCYRQRTMTVTGMGKILVEPTIVQIQLEVRTEDERLSLAQQQNAQVMNQVIESHLELGIPRESIQTVSYNIFPRYDYVDGKQLFKGYEVTNAITVQISAIERAGEIIDIAVQNGVNSVSSIQFGVENEEFYYQQALRLALQNAQVKARTMAEKMQLQLDPRPIKIIEESRGQPVPFRAVAMAEQSSATPIEQGQIEISAKVEVQFQF